MHLQRPTAKRSLNIESAEGILLMQYDYKHLSSKEFQDYIKQIKNL